MSRSQSIPIEDHAFNLRSYELFSTEFYIRFKSIRRISRSRTDSLQWPARNNRNTSVRVFTSNFVRRFRFDVFVFDRFQTTADRQSSNVLRTNLKRISIDKLCSRENESVLKISSYRTIESRAQTSAQ